MPQTMLTKTSTWDSIIPEIHHRHSCPDYTIQEMGTDEPERNDGERNDGMVWYPIISRRD
jgi:hypothetical protein